MGESITSLYTLIMSKWREHQVHRSHIKELEMSHFLDRLKFMSKVKSTFSDGHGAVVDEDRPWLVLELGIYWKVNVKARTFVTG